MSSKEHNDCEVGMAWSGHYVVDPHDIESRFANEDGMAFMDSIFEEPTAESLARIEKVKDILETLPAREADFVDLYFFRKLKQTDIARIFGVSQPTVCYRLQRAASRIKFMISMPAVCAEGIDEALAKVITNPMDASIMRLMRETTCQSEVAKRLGVSQGLVRHRFLRIVRQMRNSDALAPYAQMFSAIAENLNILREVRRPAWDARITHVID